MSDHENKKPPIALDERPATDRVLRCVIVDEEFNETPVEFDDPQPTGRQIAEAGGFRPADDAIVLQQLNDGSLEEIRLEELVKLKKNGVERFFVMKGDRTYRMAIDGLRIEWPREVVTRETILKLAGKAQTFDLFRDFDDAPDEEVEQGEIVHLDGDGIERFKTKASERLVTVFYKEEPRELERRVYTTEELRDVFGVEPGYVLELVSKEDEFIELKPGRELLIKKNMRFVSHAPCGQSS